MASPSQPVKRPAVPVPDEWKSRCEIIKINQLNKAEFIPLHVDFLKAFASVTELDFTVFFAVGWDMYEFMRPKEFSIELVKEMLTKHKEFPSATRICVRRTDYGRFEKLAEKYKRAKFVGAAQGAAMAYEPVLKSYLELSAASQTVVRGYIDNECYSRVARASSSIVMSLSSTKDIVRFLTDIVGREPALYDHGAITALVTAAITWNILKLSKRECKLAVQSAMIHDIERHCSYLGKPANPAQISTLAVKEINALVTAGQGFHETNIAVMQQYRERFDGAGIPKGLKGIYEDGNPFGILRIARATSIGCAFSEYMLKRQEKLPLPQARILQLLTERAEKGEFDLNMVKEFISDIADGKTRKPTDKVKTDGTDQELEDDDEDCGEVSEEYS